MVAWVWSISQSSHLLDLAITNGFGPVASYSWRRRILADWFIIGDVCDDGGSGDGGVGIDGGNRPLARYVKLQVAHALGTFSPPPPVSDPDIHHGTCVTHVPWCMPGYLTSKWLSFEVGGGENVPGIPGACATRNFTYLVRGSWSNVFV